MLTGLLSLITLIWTSESTISILSSGPSVNVIFTVGDCARVSLTTSSKYFDANARIAVAGLDMPEGGGFRSFGIDNLGQRLEGFE